MNKHCYKITIKNNFLHKEKLLTAASKELLNEKVKKQRTIWAKEESSLKKSLSIHKAIVLQEEKTKNAILTLNKYKNILNSSLNKNYELNFDISTKAFKYEIFKYTPPKELYTEKKILESKLKELSNSSLLNKFLNRITINKNTELYILTKKLNLINEKISNERKRQLTEYSKNKEISRNKLDIENTKLKKLKIGYENLSKIHVKNYFTKVLNNSNYDFKYKRKVILNYNNVNKELVVSLQLPDKNTIPSIIGYKYIKSTGKITEKLMTTKEFKEFYTNIIYQIILKTLNELFNADYNNALHNITINGFVYLAPSTSDKTTRIYVNKSPTNLTHSNGLNKKNSKLRIASSTIISASTNKCTFNKLNLKKYTYEEAILKLNGTISKNILKATEINISNNLKSTNINTTKISNNVQSTYAKDSRTSSKTILANQKPNTNYKNNNNKINLATMPWEQFEDLIGELFSKEFSNKSSIVEVTKRSRDGGADVIVTDLDPIRGGKYIIQVKRYNRTVPPTAIRDLYGTIQHESAMKGILVTTSDFGSDSFNFIKDKSLVLINGDTLLKMLNKHGYNKFEIILRKK